MSHLQTVIEVGIKSKANINLQSCVEYRSNMIILPCYRADLGRKEAPVQASTAARRNDQF